MNGKPECYVTGTMAAMLWLARLLGLAPLKFVKNGPGWRVSLSAAWTYYGYFIMAIIIVVSSSALIMDLNLDPEQSVHINTKNTMSGVVATTTSVYSMVIVATSVFRAPKLMLSLIACMNRVQKLNYELNSLNISHSMHNERNNKLIFFITTAVTIVFLLFDYGIKLRECFLKNQRQVWVGVLYLALYCSFWIVQLREMQFVMTTLHVMYCLRDINCSLKNMLQDLAEGNELLKLTLFGSKICKVTKKKYCKRTCNKISDASNTRSDFQTTKSHGEIVHRLALAYSSTCDVVRDVDSTHGLIVLMLFGSFLLHLITSPYYFIIYLHKEHTSHTDWTKHTLSVAVQAMWCFFHAANLLLVVEPCHLTLVEMEKTCDLVSHLMSSVESAHDPLAIELEMFMKHLFLNKTSYSAKHVATISRPLLATIFGCITTYLVILIQL